MPDPTPRDLSSIRTTILGHFAMLSAIVLLVVALEWVRALLERC